MGNRKLCPKCISTSGMKCLIAVLLAAIGVTSACKFIRVNNVTYAHEPQEYLPEGLKISHPTGLYVQQADVQGVALNQINSQNYWKQWSGKNYIYHDSSAWVIGEISSDYIDTATLAAGALSTPIMTSAASTVASPIMVSGWTSNYTVWCATRSLGKQDL